MSKITPMMTALHYGHSTEERITAIDNMIAEHYQNDIKNTICEAFGWYRKHSIPIKNIDKMKAEIYQEAKNINRDEYTNDIQNARADGILFALGMATGIIDKYCKENTNEST